jgi:hypothetical protein
MNIGNSFSFISKIYDMILCNYNLWKNVYTFLQNPILSQISKNNANKYFIRVLLHNKNNVNNINTLLIYCNATILLQVVKDINLLYILMYHR